MHDKELSSRMAAVAIAAERAARVEPAVTVRARSNHRRIAVVSAFVVVGLSLAAGLPLVVAMAPDSPSRSPAPGNSAWPDPTMIPLDLRMPHEGEAGWQRQDDRSTLGAFVPCRAINPSEADATLPGRTDARTLTGRTESVTYTEQLLVYATDAAAATAMRALVQSAARCGWQTAVQPGHGPDAEGLYATRALPGNPTGRFGYAGALRRGNVLFVVLGVVEDSIVDGYDANAINTIGELLCARRQLCSARPAAEASWSPVPPPAN
jgi:hypothetical protein